MPHKGNEAVLFRWKGWQESASLFRSPRVLCLLPRERRDLPRALCPLVGPVPPQPYTTKNNAKRAKKYRFALSQGGAAGFSGAEWRYS